MQDAYQLFLESKDPFASKATEDQIKLLLLQKELESTLGSKFVGQSLSDTLYNLVLLNQAKRVAKIKSDFKVPDRRFWWLKVRALAQLGDWISLEKFAKEKKSPIGYAPFVDVCLKANRLEEAEKYIPKIQEVNQRVDYWIRIG